MVVDLITWYIMNVQRTMQCYEVNIANVHVFGQFASAKCIWLCYSFMDKMVMLCLPAYALQGLFFNVVSRENKVGFVIVTFNFGHLPSLLLHQQSSVWLTGFRECMRWLIVRIGPPGCSHICM